MPSVLFKKKMEDRTGRVFSAGTIHFISDKNFNEMSARDPSGVQKIEEDKVGRSRKALYRWDTAG